MISTRIRTLLAFSAIALLVTACGGGNSGGQQDNTLSGSGSALLTWTPPTMNTDNTTLTDHAGYKIFYGNAPNGYQYVATINNSTISEYLVENLPKGTWYFAVTAFDTSGNESTKSNQASKVILD